MLTVVAPASITAPSTRYRKSGSERPASSGLNSMSSQPRPRRCFTARTALPTTCARRGASANHPPPPPSFQTLLPAAAHAAHETTCRPPANALAPASDQRVLLHAAALAGQRRQARKRVGGAGLGLGLGHLVRRHLQLVLHVDGRRGQEGVHARPLGEAHRLPRAVQVPAAPPTLGDPRCARYTVCAAALPGPPPARLQRAGLGAR